MPVIITTIAIYMKAYYNIMALSMMIKVLNVAVSDSESLIIAMQLSTKTKATSLKLIVKRKDFITS